MTTKRKKSLVGWVSGIWLDYFRMTDGICYIEETICKEQKYGGDVKVRITIEELP